MAKTTDGLPWQGLAAVAAGFILVIVMIIVIGSVATPCSSLGGLSGSKCRSSKKADATASGRAGGAADRHSEAAPDSTEHSLSEPETAAGELSTAAAEPEEDNDAPTLLDGDAEDVDGVDDGDGVEVDVDGNTIRRLDDSLGEEEAEPVSGGYTGGRHLPVIAHKSARAGEHLRFRSRVRDMGEALTDEVVSGAPLTHGALMDRTVEREEQAAREANIHAIVNLARLSKSGDSDAAHELKKSLERNGFMSEDGGSRRSEPVGSYGVMGAGGDSTEATLAMTDDNQKLLQEARARRSASGFYRSEEEQRERMETARALQSAAHENPDMSFEILSAVGADGVNRPVASRVTRARATIKRAALLPDAEEPPEDTATTGRRRRPMSQRMFANRPMPAEMQDTVSVDQV